MGLVGEGDEGRVRYCRASKSRSPAIKRQCGNVTVKRSSRDARLTTTSRELELVDTHTRRKPHTGTLRSTFDTCHDDAQDLTYTRHKSTTASFHRGRILTVLQRVRRCQTRSPYLSQARSSIALGLTFSSTNAQSFLHAMNIRPLSLARRRQMHLLPCASSSKPDPQ